MIINDAAPLLRNYSLRDVYILTCSLTIRIAMASFASFNVNTTLGASRMQCLFFVLQLIPFLSGAYQIGVLVSYMLFGVTTAQTYIYYGRFPDDSPKFKALVCKTT
jgi:hypothetical protein